MRDVKRTIRQIEKAIQGDKGSEIRAIPSSKERAKVGKQIDAAFDRANRGGKK